MADSKAPTPTPNPDHPPGEVERDNDAHRDDIPQQREHDSTAQETAQEVTPKPGGA